MTRDLRSALTDIVQQTADEQTTRIRDHAGLDAGTIAHRAGRARARRAAVTTATALVAVVGVVFAGSALADRRDPLPAETPTVAPSPSVTTPAPTPTPTETTPTVVLPTGDPSLPFGVCGSLDAAAPVAPWTTEVALDTRTGATALAAGARLPISTQFGLAATTDSVEGFAEPTDGPQLAVLTDGVVVGTARLHGSSTTAWKFTGGAYTWPTTHSDAIDLTICAAEGQPDVTAGLPLPAGTYEVVAWGEVAMLPSEDVDYEGASAAEFNRAVADKARSSVRGEAIPVTVTGTAQTTEPRPGDSVPFRTPVVEAAPVCGDPAPTPTTVAEGDLTLTWAGPGAETATFNYAGPGRLRERTLGIVWLWAVQDGVIVGSSYFESDGYPRIDLAAGGLGTEFEVAGTITACQPGQDRPSVVDEGGVPLPAGEYQVYASAGVFEGDRVLPDGTVVPSAADDLTHDIRWYDWAFSEPVTVTVP